MKKNAHTGPTIFAFLLITAIALLLPARATAADSTPPEFPKRVIVKFKPGLAADVERALPASLELTTPQQSARGEWFRQHGVTSVKPVYPQIIRQKKEQGAGFGQQINQVRGRFAKRSRRVHSAKGPPDVSRTYILELSDASEPALALAIKNLNADPEVEYAEREQMATAQFTPDDPYYATTGSWGQTYRDLWGLYTIQCGSAWDTTNGQGVVVAVVDTGLDFYHPDIVGNIWTNTAEIPGNGIDDDGNGYVDDVYGYDFVGASYLNPVPDNNPVDAYGHGTHVAGIIAAVGDNGLGVVGVAWGARIMVVRGLDNNGIGTDAELANAVLYAANNGADVINNSYGGQGYSQVLADAMEYAESLGCVIVAAAGNSSSDVKDFFPASDPACIVVTATDPNDANAYFSNWGERVDVAAPGVDILSLLAAGTSIGTPVGTNLTRASGTSMAAPHVSGLAALILSQHPDYSPEQVRQALRTSADDVNAPGFDVYTGYGRINASNALALPPVLEARIQSPSFDQAVTNPVAIEGSAQGPGFDHYTLEYGAGQTPASWTLMQQSTNPVGGGTLGTFDPSCLPDGRYTIRLRAFNQAGSVFEDKQGLIVDYASISDPAPSMSIDSVHKPGTVVQISGNAIGPTFQSFQLQWARGANATNGWSSDGMTVVGGGAAPVVDGQLGFWETSSNLPADFYTIRVLVQNACFTNEEDAMVYLEPDLASTNDPLWLDFGLQIDNSILPATDASGNIWLDGLAYNFGQEPYSPAKLWSFSPDLSVIRTQSMTNSGYRQPAVGNFDGLPGDEIAAIENYKLEVFNPDLTSWFLTTPTGSSGFAFSSILMADINGDGQEEVLALGTTGTNASLLYVWNSSGAQLTTNFPIVVSGPYLGSILAVDLDGDGKKEILVAKGIANSNAFSFAAFNSDGTPRAWPGTIYPGGFHQWAAGDFDRTGRAQIVFTYADPTNRNQAALLGPDGVMKPGWPVNLGGIAAGENQAYIAIADMDRDGRDEIVIASKLMLHVLRADGTPMNSSWPMTSMYYDLGGLVVADIDGDTYPEILCLRQLTVIPDSGPSAWLYSLGAYNRNAQEVKSWPLFGGNGSIPFNHGSVTVGDFNQDGKVDIVVHEPQIESSGLVQGGVVTAFALNAPYRAQDMDWPMNLHDPQNSAVRMLPLDHTPPVVNMTAPTDGATVSNVVTLVAAATDDVHVAGVQFVVDGVNVGAQVTAAPYSINWNTQGVTNGSHTVTAVASDNSGNQATAPAITVMLSNIPPPTISITAPTNLQPVVGTIIVSAIASSEAGVAGVQFQLDGANLGAEETNAPFTVTWNTRAGTKGIHTLSAIVRDTLGFTNSDTVTVTVSNDWTPPTVSFISPTNGAIVAGIITISAAASDNVAVSNVSFYLDNVYTYILGGASVPPYSVVLNTTVFANGPQTLRVNAVDTSGNLTVATINVTLNNDLIPPTVSITSPTNNALLSGIITVAANAADNVGVAGVQFMWNSTSLGAEVTNPPYTIAWDTRTVRSGSTVGNGSYTLSAVARDAAGNKTTSAISVVVTNDLTPPSISITAPTLNAVVSGVVTLSANASDNVGVVGVQFQLDGTNVGTELTTPPYALNWNSASFPNGYHNLLAFARDAAGNRAFGSTYITVKNPPSVSISAPTNNANVAGIVTVSAAASSASGIAALRFNLDGTNFGSAQTSPPFAVIWDTTTGTNATHTWAAIAYDTTGNVATSAVVNVTVTNAIKINFQPATAPTYPGYAVDGGAVYGLQTNGYSYGWNANNAKNAADRNSSLSPDQRYDTLIAMQSGGTFTWEIGVRNGTYSVHVVAGDASNFNGTYKINVEGVLTVNGSPTTNVRWLEGTSNVTVTNGLLTVSNANGAKNNKVCFLEITPVN